MRFLFSGRTAKESRTVLLAYKKCWLIAYDTTVCSRCPLSLYRMCVRKGRRRHGVKLIAPDAFAVAREELRRFFGTAMLVGLIVSGCLHTCRIKCIPI